VEVGGHVLGRFPGLTVHHFVDPTVDSAGSNYNGTVHISAVMQMNTDAFGMRLDVQDLSIGSDSRISIFEALVEDSDRRALQYGEE
jgi:hypothetical protein